MIKPDASQLKAADPTLSAWVAASAGSGKTSVLSDRVLRLLLTGVPPEKILCLTFTTNAAAEMSNRLTARLSDFAAEDDVHLFETLSALTGTAATPAITVKARRLFAELLESKGGVKTMTIHAFAQSVLKRFPIEAGVSPRFDVADDRLAAELMAQAQADVLNGGDVQQPLETLTALLTVDKFSELMAEMTSKLALFDTLSKKYPDTDTLRHAYEALFALPPDTTHDTLMRHLCHIDNADSLRVAASLMIANVKSKTDVARGTVIADFLSREENDRPLIANTYIRAFLTTEDSLFASLATKAIADDVLPVLTVEAERVLDIKLKMNAERVMRASLALAVVGNVVAKRYAVLKSKRGVLDYNDMIAATLRLLTDGAAWVMYKLDGGIDHILLDEAQDTSPDQWGIVKALTDEFFAGDSAAAKKRTLFIVGDKKQSIYSFQGADPDVFEKMHAYFEQKTADAHLPFENIPLYKSFRSTQAVIDVVNDVLRTPAGNNGVLNAGEDGTHVVHRIGDGGRVEIWDTEKPEKNDSEQTVRKPVERTTKNTPATRLVHRIAKRIADMLQNKEMLVAKNRPVRPSDILILLKKRTTLMEPLIRELKALNVPVAGVDRLKLTDHLAVLDLMVLGDFLLFPQDDLSLATVLRSPLCGVSEEDLFSLCANRGTRSVWDVLKTRTDGTLGQARAFLSEMLSLTDKLSPYDLYAHALHTCGKMKAFGERLGVQAYDAIEEFLSLALKDETEEIPSLQRFLNRLRSFDIVIKRDTEALDAVRLMTVHGAKGLQAPIVFLPDTRQMRENIPTCYWPRDKKGVAMPLWIPSNSGPSEICQRQKKGAEADEIKESNRLLYVALTRAADRLYVCGYDSTKRPVLFNWYDTVRNALDKDDVCLAQKENDGTLIVENAQTAPVPASANTVSERVAAASLPSWATTPAPQESIPPKPLAPSKMTQEDDIEYPSPLSENREQALRRGTLIHKLLELGAQTPHDVFDAAAHRFLAKNAPDRSDDERTALVDSAQRIFKMPDCSVLFQKNALAEVSVTGVVGTTPVSGKIDRLAVTPNAVYIADYKSNQSVPSSVDAIPDAYVAQMGLYRALIGRIYPNRKIHCLLIWTQNATATEIPDALFK